MSKRLDQTRIDRIAAAIAEADSADYWVPEITDWETSEEWKREAYPDEYPSSAYEDRERYRKQARAALLALEPEAREERRPSRVLNEYDDSTTRGLRRGEEVLRQLEHHWAADSATQAIEELLRLRRIVEAREVTVAKIEAEAREMYAADESEYLGRWPEWDSPKNVCKARYLERAEAALEAAREVE